MKLTKYIAVACCFIIWWDNTPAQNYLTEQFDLARSLYSKENYYDAVTELKRLLFFDSTSAYAFEANYLAGVCYKKGAKLSEAIYHFTLAEINANSVQQLYDSKIQQIRCNILRRTTSRALDLLDSVSADEIFNQYKSQLVYWRGWAYIFSNRWKEASEEFASLDSAKELYELTLKVSENSYSPRTSRLLSYFIPGAGQFYTGNYLSGILSLGWNILWGYLTIESFIEDRVFDGILIANFLWLRFYNGNLYNAEKFAKDENLNLYNEALYYLQYKFKGSKP
ncbi:MAG: hypothetical protein Kow0098_12180 [Ignavibacteriaceae bacterium]